MILAFHTIISAYGFWLPNDPRGSWSACIRKLDLLLFGDATKVTTHRSLAHRPHDRRARLAAKSALAHPPVRFTGYQARAIGRGFAEFVQASGLVVWACAIMPEHLHLVIRRHRYRIEQVVNLLKGRASTALIREGLHPFEPINGNRARPFAQDGWNVFLRTTEDIHGAIGYVEDNPEREGLRHQRWPFVTAFDESQLDDLF